MESDRCLRRSILLPLLLVSAQLAAQPAPDPLTIASLYADRSIIGTSPEKPVWSSNGRRLLFLWNDEGLAARDIWSADPASGQRRRLTRFAGKDKGGAQGVSEAVWLAGGRIAFVRGGALAVLATNGVVTPVMHALRGVSQLAASADGASLAFVAEGGLWVMPAGAQPRLLVPAARQVAVESFQWARDGKRIAFVLADQRQMRDVTITYDSGGRSHSDIVSRAFPGDAGNIAYQIGTIDLAAGSVPRMVTRTNIGDPIWSYRLTGDGHALLVNASDLTIKHHFADIYDVASGRRTRAYTHDDPTRIRPDWQAEWDAEDRGFFLLSDRDGFNQIYHVATPGARPRQVTRGDHDIDTFEVDRAHRQLYFRSNQPGYADRGWFRTGFDGNRIDPVAATAGTHDAVFAPGYDRLVDRASDDATPPELYLRTPIDPAGATRITQSPLPAFAARHWAQVRYVDYRSHVDGMLLTARVLLPPRFDPTRRYPVIVGSVYSDAVRNQWGGRNAHPTWGLDQYLVAHGYIVVNPGIRGSFGRGKAWNRPMLHSYGALDIDDIQDGAQHVVDLGWGDGRRIGIWGSSYGGLMTLMSLFKKPGFYAAGVAGAPASNVAHAYPEQEWIMGIPSGPDFPARYERQSALYQTAGLRDPLMIIHGTRDEVVLYADTMALTERLIAGGKSFELVTLPGAGHAWDMETLPQTRFAFDKLIAFFDRELRPDTP